MSDWVLFSDHVNSKTYALGSGKKSDEYCFHSILQESCHENGRDSQLIGQVDPYPKMPEEDNEDSFSYAVNKFRNKTTGMIDVVTYYDFDNDTRVYKNVSSVMDENVDIEQIALACKTVKLIYDPKEPSPEYLPSSDLHNLWCKFNEENDIVMRNEFYTEDRFAELTEAGEYDTTDKFADLQRTLQEFELVHKDLVDAMALCCAELNHDRVVEERKRLWKIIE